MTRSRARLLIFGAAIAVFAVLFVGAVTSIAEKRVPPPKPEKLVGVWIGFTNDELNFYRLDLRADFTGYCACVPPSDTSLHEYGVKAYKVTRWTTEGWKLIVSLTAIDPDAESIYLKGSFNGFALNLEVGETDGGWKRQLLLRNEARIVAANEETKDKIKKVEKK